MNKVRELSDRLNAEAIKRRRLALKLKGQGKTVQEIADLWGISKQRVSEIIASAKRSQL